MLMNEVYSLTSSTGTTNVNYFQETATIGWNLGQWTPWLDIDYSDKNTDATATNDTTLYFRPALRFDATPNLAFVPYVYYYALKNGVAPANPWAFRFRMDYKF